MSTGNEWGMCSFALGDLRYHQQSDIYVFAYFHMFHLKHIDVQIDKFRVVIILFSKIYPNSLAVPNFSQHYLSVSVLISPFHSSL